MNSVRPRYCAWCAGTLLLLTLTAARSAVGQSSDYFRSRIEIDRCHQDRVVAFPSQVEGLPYGVYRTGESVELVWTGPYDECEVIYWYSDGRLFSQDLIAYVTAMPFVTRVGLNVIGCNCTSLPVPVIHDSDQDRDFEVSLAELLRIIQIYNSDGYTCVADSEDGFSISFGTRDCYVHTADFEAPFWQIDLNEVMRVIQFYNSDGYHRCEGTEDGYCPGI